MGSYNYCEIVKHPTYVAITNYGEHRDYRIEKIISYFENFREKKFVGCVYDKDTNELRIFGGVSVDRLQKITGYPVRFDFSSIESKPISIRLEGFPRKELQKKMIQFLIGEGDYYPNNNFTQLSCNAETGEGKTFCAVAAITHYRVKTMIIVHRINIKENWIEEVSKFTDTDKRRIVDLNRNLLAKFYNGEAKANKYDIFVVVHRSLANFAEEYGHAALNEVFSMLGIGLKIYDEAHLEFNDTTLVDCYTNVAKTLYLTATPRLADPKANKVYQNVFHDIPSFDQRKLGYTDAKKHILMVCFKYNSHPGIDAQKRCYNSYRKCFSAVAHSDYQVEEDSMFFIIIDSCLKKFTIGSKFRTLILVSKIDSCKIMAEFVREHYPDISVGIYNSSIDAKEKKRVLKECNLIISTNKSLGVAMTIDKLQFVLNCEAHRNYGDQCSGRLRKLGDGIPHIYAELVDTGFKSIKSQWESRIKHYLDIFRDVIIMEE